MFILFLGGFVKMKKSYILNIIWNQIILEKGINAKLVAKKT